MSRPLISCLLVTYNQEQWVEEALQSILAQTYSPLEIVVSDDASTDGTYPLLQRLIDAYDGPHRVVLRRNAVRRNVVGHLAEAMPSTTGELIVVAAGDDVSPAAASGAPGGGVGAIGKTRPCAEFRIAADRRGRRPRRRSARVRRAGAFHPGGFRRSCRRLLWRLGGLFARGVRALRATRSVQYFRGSGAAVSRRVAGRSDHARRYAGAVAAPEPLQFRAVSRPAGAGARLGWARSSTSSSSWPATRPSAWPISIRFCRRAGSAVRLCSTCRRGCAGSSPGRTPPPRRCNARCPRWRCCAQPCAARCRSSRL